MRQQKKKQGLIKKLFLPIVAPVALSLATALTPGCGGGGGGGGGGVIPPTNAASQFDSTPNTEAVEGENYFYNILTSDKENDTRTITALVLPSWMTLTDNGDGTATLTGNPSDTDSGTTQNVSLNVNDGKSDTIQDFAVTIANTETIGGTVYNPATGNPVPGIDITFTGINGTTLNYNATTDANGQWSLTMKNGQFNTIFNDPSAPAATATKMAAQSELERRLLEDSEVEDSSVNENPSPEYTGTGIENMSKDELLKLAALNPGYITYEAQITDIQKGSAQTKDVPLIPQEYLTFLNETIRTRGRIVKWAVEPVIWKYMREQSTDTTISQANSDQTDATVGKTPVITGGAMGTPTIVPIDSTVMPGYEAGVIKIYRDSTLLANGMNNAEIVGDSVIAGYVALKPSASQSVSDQEFFEVIFGGGNVESEEFPSIFNNTPATFATTADGVAIAIHEARSAGNETPDREIDGHIFIGPPAPASAATTQGTSNNAETIGLTPRKNLEAKTNELSPYLESNLYAPQSNEVLPVSQSYGGENSFESVTYNSTPEGYTENSSTGKVKIGEENLNQETSLYKTIMNPENVGKVAGGLATLAGLFILPVAWAKRRKDKKSLDSSLE